VNQSLTVRIRLKGIKIGLTPQAGHRNRIARQK
jgi:hypothetical protein